MVEGAGHSGETAITPQSLCMTKCLGYTAKAECMSYADADGRAAKQAPVASRIIPDLESRYQCALGAGAVTQYVSYLVTACYQSPSQRPGTGYTLAGLGLPRN
jgi:hypothetical protein